MFLLPKGTPTFHQTLGDICTICLVSCYEPQRWCPESSEPGLTWTRGPIHAHMPPPLDNRTLVFLWLTWHDSNSPQTGPLTISITWLLGSTSGTFSALSLNFRQANPSKSRSKAYPLSLPWANPSKAVNLNTSYSTFHSSSAVLILPYSCWS